MKVLIIEDETLAIERLELLLKEYDASIEVVGKIDSIEEAIDFLQTKPLPDLLLMDIHLSDGQSFEIFKQIPLQVPVIFTTAFDQYAIQAFKYYSVDYLLKPVTQKDLAQALQKYESMGYRPQAVKPMDFHKLSHSFQQANDPYKKRFLVRYGDKMQFKEVEEITYFYAEDKTVYLITTENKRFIVDHTLESLEELLDPRSFFRVNRKFIVKMSAISEFRSHINSRLKLQLNPPPSSEVIVSREKVQDFKLWIDQ